MNKISFWFLRRFVVNVFAIVEKEKWNEILSTLNKVNMSQSILTMKLKLTSLNLIVIRKPKRKSDNSYWRFETELQMSYTSLEFVHHLKGKIHGKFCSSVSKLQCWAILSANFNFYYSYLYNHRQFGTSNGSCVCKRCNCQR